MLEIKNFSKSYVNNKKVVSNLSLHVERGDIYGFIGANGAGKTTTIKSIVGIHSFDSGDIKVAGLSMKDEMIACKKIMAYIPDNPDLYEHLTGFQYINFVADLYEVSNKERKDKIQKYGNLFEMTDHLSNIILSYSHGMKQRLAIISALVHSPKLLILDEPFVGLDPKATFLLKNIMREFVKEGGAIFFSTHVLEVAEKLCNKIAIIKNGRLLASGYTEKVKGNQSLESYFMEVQSYE